MMMNLFSVFDPCTGYLSLNWLSSMMFMIMINYKMWFIKNNTTWIISKMYLNMQKEMFNLMPYKGSTLMFMSMFIMILVNNIMGLLPYTFTSSSHLVFSMSLALPMWLAMMTYGWLMKTNKMFEHLVPIGTPSILMPFMIIIETISNLIRPGSLAVRLSANMIAGHLLMSLLGSNNKMIMTTILLTLFMTLMTFEFAVSIIQSYVFMTLMTLYSSEI